MKPSSTYFMILTISILLYGCMSSVSVQVMKPADITLPDHINKIAVANRSLSDKDNKVMNVVEGILTGEGLFMDRIGSDECIGGITDVLVESPRFDVIRPANVELKGTGTSAFPTPLDWDEVTRICALSDADALLLLEAFDSDSDIGIEMKKSESKDKEGNVVVNIEHLANMKMKVSSGWRIYDPKTKVIIDEHKASDYMDFNAEGKSPEEARSHLIPKRDAVNKTGVYAGQQYGYRIAPMWIRVSRSYYAKGCDDMKIATRKARANNWDGAAEIWKKLAERSNVEKLKSRNSYNMALASEISGNLDIALMWARKSYEDYGNKKARSYIRVLERRISDEERLKEQIGTKQP